MATIKAIEATSVHQIQSGQVIIDLCSVAKELVENGLDAGATSIDVRFKNQGLDLIEVQDNGTGISPENHQTLALKHYTSKLSTYSDLSTLETFGFRGEALSSLCALSKFTVVTCLQSEAPKGSKLDFETSGKLKSTSVVAAQKGTTVSVENLFQNLPVRRRELERNIKREWGKVISLLNQYACIQTGVKFTVSQQPNKGKRIVLFSTKGNKSTRENIINVFGAKTMAGLVVLDLKLDLEPTTGLTQKWSTQGDGGTHEIMVRGHISRPVHGEGRQTPDRQMFYVNSRPCGLPQFAKVFNEVYRSYNSSQSPFIFADIQLDTHLYDVNVSPDKRTILLHDQGRMLDNLRESLIELFEKQEYTVPVSQVATSKLPPFKKSTVTREDTNGSEGGSTETSSAAPDKVAAAHAQEDDGPDVSEDEEDTSGALRIKNLASAKALSRDAQMNSMTRWLDKKLASQEEASPEPKKAATLSLNETATEDMNETVPRNGELDVSGTSSKPDEQVQSESTNVRVSAAETGDGDDAFITRLSRMKRSFLPESLRDEPPYYGAPDELSIPAIAKPTKPIDTAPLSVSAPRPPKRSSQEVATITIGDHSVTSVIGTPAKRIRVDEAAVQLDVPQKAAEAPKAAAPLPSFGGRLTQMFSAASASRTSREREGLHTEDSESVEDDDEGDAEEVEDVDEDEERSEDDHFSDAEAVPDQEKVVDSDSESSASSALFVEQEEEYDETSASPAVEEAAEVLDEDDGEYINEEEAKAREKLEPQKSPTAAEEVGHEASEENQKRTQTFLKGGGKNKHSTQALLQRLTVDEEWLQKRLVFFDAQRRGYAPARKDHDSEDLDTGLEAGTQVAEDKLSLTIHKGDFSRMKIVGQFNLGFILGVRPGTSAPSCATASARADGPRDDDELFIIDQHASDEKFNFERLQATTIVQSQRLVRPKPLELTAIEEEIVIENHAALEANGFQVEADTSGDEPVGSRCQLLSLPLSRETTFSLADLEELISLLGDSPTTTSSPPPVRDDGNGDGDGNVGHHSGSTAAPRRHIPRPSKVRKMFAMRACRSSVMIGKALSHRQMEKVVRHMGDMEKPWNCPHGRPTMRHLCALGTAWDEKGWAEGDHGDGVGGRTTDWAGYVSRMRQ
ncbi:hypothetical protein J7T55_012656 [Diaporthe amygdali]|uniref:uncharacterized protein n=1 Tax=Phomopsis amygdali TaxID=1214568 RepID=UPI0022FED681|nr:uncharacterized protein J7T55_012656 [Diaporthe amygdali]KAJ0115377.1 hypothetical protein J7T55_012656 [Diaporthe amygdali]